MLRISKIESLGTHEGPGVRFVIFTQGCNIRCIYCHNPETQCHKSGQDKSISDLVRLIDKNKSYFGSKGGVTVSGGEPLIQAEKLIKFFKLLKYKNIHVCLDTNGCILNETVKNLLYYVDLVLLDIKHMEAKWHGRITGSDKVASLDFARYLEKINKPFWVRYVLVPGYTDQKEYVRKLGQFFEGFNNLERIEILPYHTLHTQKYEELGKEFEQGHLKPPEKKVVYETKKILDQYVSNVLIR